MESQFIRKKHQMSETTPPSVPAGFSNRVGNPPADLPALTTALMDTPENHRLVMAAMKEANLDKPETLTLWGSKVQENLGKVSLQLVNMTKSKDAGPIGAALTSLVLRIKGFDVGDIEQGEKHLGLFSKLFKKATLPIAIAVQRFEAVQNQVNGVVRDLDKHIGVLMRDMVGLERIYAENVKAYESVKIYIEAGHLILREIDEIRLPALKAEVKDDDPLSSERLGKMIRVRQRVERRTHDLVLTRTALFQGLPAVALIEDNDANLIERIQSTITNAVPLWHQRIALLLSTRHGQDATAAERDANDLTNQLLEQTAGQLRLSSKAIRTEVERGIFDAESLRRANDEIVGALTDAIRIYDEAVTRRAGDLLIADQCEKDMRQALEGIKALGA
jgi:uncharacterized protein YaaN involved in tellurite resistance